MLQQLKVLCGINSAMIQKVLKPTCATNTGQHLLVRCKTCEKLQGSHFHFKMRMICSNNWSLKMKLTACRDLGPKPQHTVENLTGKFSGHSFMVTSFNVLHQKKRGNFKYPRMCQKVQLREF